MYPEELKILRIYVMILFVVMVFYFLPTFIVYLYRFSGCMHMVLYVIAICFLEDYVPIIVVLVGSNFEI